MAASKKKDTIKSEFHFQTHGKDLTVEDLIKSAKEDLAGRDDINLSELKSLEFYIKPEDSKVYFVANNDTLGSIDL